ncbi:MAG TPA: Glu/Leu/Phe/Val dehydrogenase dimerization domain-containing protein [Candidatus Saccharimonadales bacterium]|nr:Glu/Leu/Phe/Val dehydrogenase dimerization domain-containing protein [Candidatus Saccharimonadales bacterium]
MDLINQLISLPPREFTDFLRSEGIQRFWFVWHPGSRVVMASHPQLQPIADWLRADKRDFLEHEGLFFQVSREHGLLQGAFVHRTCRGQGAGGVRLWTYETLEDYLRDGLRLSAGMTFKNALAGLWWGGGKGVMARDAGFDDADPAVRKSLYREYGDLITSLCGCYVTAEDAGTSADDMVSVYGATRFTTCIPPRLGGSGDPSVPTARGVVCGMEAALEFIGDGDLSGKTVAVQGLGHVGGRLAGLLAGKGVGRIVACDIAPSNVERIRREVPGSRLEARVVEPGDTGIFGTECDILAPCATGAVLGPATIPRLRARIVCGAANNQLEDTSRDGALLAARKIVYVPDFLTNRMGIVSCADEHAGTIPDDPRVEQHLTKDWEFGIHKTVLKVLEASAGSGKPPGTVATEMADRLSLELHPIFGHRGRKIIDALAASSWHEKG